MQKRSSATVATPKHSHKAPPITPEKSRVAAAVRTASGPVKAATPVKAAKRRRRESVSTCCSEPSTESYDGDATAAAFAAQGGSLGSTDALPFVWNNPWGNNLEANAGSDDDSAEEAFLLRLGWVRT